MKKLLFILVTITIVSCSKDETSNGTDDSINPPSWIQGVWLNEESEILGFEFKSDDFCMVSMNITSCNKEQLVLMKNGGFESNVYEETSANRYLVKITLHTLSTEYEFEKISSTKISSNWPIEGSIYIKQ